MSYRNTHVMRLEAEALRNHRAAIDRASDAFRRHHRPHAPVTVEVLEPFWLAGGKLARVGQHVELAADEVVVLEDIGRVRRVD